MTIYANKIKYAHEIEHTNIEKYIAILLYWKPIQHSTNIFMYWKPIQHSTFQQHHKVFIITHFWCSERENSFQSSLLWRWNLTQCRAFNLIKSRSCGCSNHMIIIISSYNHIIKSRSCGCSNHMIIIILAMITNEVDTLASDRPGLCNNSST